MSDEAGAHTVGHVHLKVRDRDRAVDFYATVLGMTVVEQYERFAFLSFGDNHHDVAVQELGENAPEPNAGVGLYHTAFEVETPGELVAIYRRVRDRNLDVWPVDHRISKALYFDDPDGNGVEVYLDTREENGRYEWRGENVSFDPETLDHELDSVEE